MKKDLKFVVIFIVIVVFSLVYLFQASYAKYRKKINGTVNGTIASWKIKINTEDITGKNTLTNNITPTFPATDYKESGVIAPNSEGYYDLTIDGSDVDVNFTYTITSVVSSTSNVTDLITTGYIVDPENSNTMITYPDSGITGELAHNTISKTIRIYIKWLDDGTASMTNTDDTNAAITTDSKALMTVTINFVQKSN